ncbi:arylamine N-acetyltransferase family protein [Cavenderia fasciculata]|uniref:Arylamine N-acetyltransferase family protein n=1 Tax=Cavenderia fasciculata TaxID=261658 RepID=F4QC41_CACFS|nr:arylamine N-acetyltransferase family protein [Cavenderia fasciculata]EGG13528.1 arylamine N-acetyltransferase family protein [Cavenderia fasciculata]|eukprot:XP_004350232.1 arylamine N-acetyltransferase family protein [Cavenderia fasciculata]
MEYLEFKRLMSKKLEVDFEGNVTFDDLPMIMSAFSTKIPYNNFHLLENQQHHPRISKQDLIEKVLVQGTGGLSYHLNGLMYHFLKDSGFNVKLVTCKLKILKSWTKHLVHISVILIYEGKQYLIEVGTGSHVPQLPIPLYDTPKQAETHGIEENSLGINGTSLDEITNKVLVQGTGGLSYHLNGLMYYFLKDSGFNVNLVTCKLKILKEWTKESVHLSIILNNRGKQFMIEVGTGSHVPQQPVILTVDQEEAESIGTVENSLGVKYCFLGKSSHHDGLPYVLKIKKPGVMNDWEPLLSTDLVVKPDADREIAISHQHALQLVANAHFCTKVSSPTHQGEVEQTCSYLSGVNNTFVIDNFKKGRVKRENNIKFRDPRFNEIVNKYMEYGNRLS